MSHAVWNRALFGLILFCFGHQAQADESYYEFQLTDGSTLTGQIVSETEQAYLVKVANGEVRRVVYTAVEKTTVIDQPVKENKPATIQEVSLLGGGDVQEVETATVNSAPHQEQNHAIESKIVFCHAQCSTEYRSLLPQHLFGKNTTGPEWVKLMALFQVTLSGPTSAATRSEEDQALGNQLAEAKQLLAEVEAAADTTAAGRPKKQEGARGAIVDLICLGQAYHRMAEIFLTSHTPTYLENDTQVLFYQSGMKQFAGTYAQKAHDAYLEAWAGVRKHPELSDLKRFIGTNQILLGAPSFFGLEKAINTKKYFRAIEEIPWDGQGYSMEQLRAYQAAQ